jgi:hypothetical protein
MNRTAAESSHFVAMISRGRATHYPTLTVKITDRYKAADGLAQPHREPSTHLPQIDRLGRTVRRGKRNVNYLNESSTVRALLFLQLHNWHTTIVDAGAQKDVVRERDWTCHAYGQWLFARSESIMKNSAQQKPGAACRRSDVARSPR